jgi:Periplasmic component of the Tol biopolymer transport system
MIFGVRPLGISAALSLIACIVLLAIGSTARSATSGSTEIISFKASGEPSFGSAPAVSADGRYVAFVSGALVPGVPASAAEYYVRDRKTGATQLVSVSTAGEPAEFTYSYGETPAISADGRFVAFTSKASNLVPGDDNFSDDIFVRDLVAGTTERVSVDSQGNQSQDGAFSAGSGSPSISSDGRFVAFTSEATNFTSSDTNGVEDIFVHDRETGVTERVNVSNSGEQADSISQHPSISADGRFVAFVRRQQLSDFSALLLMDTLGADSHSRLARL